MRNYLLFAIGLVYLCCDSLNKKKERTILVDSNGAIGQVTVIIQNIHTDSIKTFLNTSMRNPLVGVPQKENSYSYIYLPIQFSKGSSKRNRLILEISKGNSSFMIKEDVYSTPQKIIKIKGSNATEIINLLTKNQEKIFKSFKDAEITWKQNKIRTFKLPDEIIRKVFGISITIPKHYRYAKKKKNFIWLRRNNEKGSLNLILSKTKYLESLEDFPLSKVRDSIGKLYIPGPIPNSYFATEHQINSVHKYVKLKDKESLETRGLWEVKHDFMAGPYLNYLIKLNDSEVLFLEGFVYDPMERKRSSLLELEAIMRSINFVKD